MSRFDFKLPDIGEGVMEGEIVQWLVKPGDSVAEDQPMVEVMTDKATVTITSPKTGAILELGGQEGEVIAVHSTLVVLDVGRTGGEAATGEAATGEVVSADGGNGATESAEPAAARDNGEDGPAATAVGEIRDQLPGMGAAGAAKGAARPVEGGDGYFHEKPLATPATRKLARDLGVDLRAVEPTGTHDRVLKEDVRRHATAAEAPAGSGASVPARGGAPEGAAPASGAAPATREPLTVRPPGAEEEAREQRHPLRGVRKRIFDAMARSKHTAAHFTFVEECDVTALKAVRGRLKAMAEEQGVRMTFLPLFVKAVVAALKKHPSLNSAYDESTGELVERGYYHIGIASATDAGLMVPVVRHADRLSLLDIAREIERLGEAAKSGRIAPEDLSGSTFTITSLGKQGGLFATPILNMPEVGILGIHQMKQKPVVRDGEIVVGDVMLLSLSFDHRIIDGHVGAAFAYEIIAVLENPDRLWLEMG